MIAVSPAEMEIVLTIIKKHVPDCDVLAFGSRFKGTHNDASDLDLAIMGKEKLGLSLMGRIKEDFMESDLPFRVDVLDYHTMSPAFREIVDSGHERVYQHPATFCKVLNSPAWGGECSKSALCRRREERES